MSESLGLITIPPPYVTTTAFPLKPDYPYGVEISPEVYVHTFGVLGARQEQRFYAGDGTTRFLVKKSGLTVSQRDAFISFWITNQGAYGQFPFARPNSDGSTTTITCRFADPTMTLDSALGSLSSVGITLIQVPADSAAPVYSVTDTKTRFPGTASSDLLNAAQTLIPLIRIQPVAAGYPAIYVSDRRCTVGGQLYQPRLLDWNGISQSIGGATDQASFVFGNADRVFTALSNDTDLWRAPIQFSLFNVATGLKIDLWTGSITNYRTVAGPQFAVTAQDGIFEVGQPYPLRKITRQCGKPHKDANNGCPNLTVGVNSGIPCDKGFDTPAGCSFHGMQPYFGGVLVQLQGVRVKDNSTGTWGFGRDNINSVSAVSDSIFDQVIPEIYVDHIPDSADPNDATRGLPVNLKIAEGRDEGDFYVALGIVGEGPIGKFADVTSQYCPHRLDGQPAHGWPKQVGSNGGCWGLRRGLGHDPAQNNDPDGGSDQFSLSQGGAGTQTYGTAKAGGTAFLEIRRKDASGLQLTTLEEHAMIGVVSKGLSRWAWTGSTGSYVRTLKAGTTNPIWITINIYLRARGLYFAPEATQRQYFDVDAAIECAAICDRTDGPSLIGDVTGLPQFRFTGVLQEQKPLRQWMQEILNNCLGYYTFSNNKLKVGIRVNSSVVTDGAFTAANIVFQSLALDPLAPAFNHLTVNFADEKFDFVNSSVVAMDIDAAAAISPPGASPNYIKGDFNLSGTPGQNQAALIAETRKREELGGITLEEQAAARKLSWKSTILSLNLEAGMIASITHPDMPDYPAQVSTTDPQGFSPNYGEGRIQSWKLNKDLSIDFTATSTCNDIYDLEVGPKPADTEPLPLPIETFYPPAGFSYSASTDGAGNLVLGDLAVGAYGSGVKEAAFSIFYIDEISQQYTAFQPINSTATTGILLGDAVAGDYLLVENEIIFVVANDPTLGLILRRGQAGTTAAAHNDHAGGPVVSVGPTPNQIQIAPGLDLVPGDRLVQLTGGAYSAIVSEYHSDNGVTLTVLPFPVATGNIVFAYPRGWRLKRFDTSIPLARGFFQSAARATFQTSIPIPFASIVMVAGSVKNAADLESEASYADFTGSPLRTLGGAGYQFSFPGCPTGQSNDVFMDLSIGMSQTFDYAYAEIGSTSGGPLETPRGVSAIEVSVVAAGGSITLSGTVDDTAVIAISVSGNNTLPAATWTAQTSGITGSSTLAQAAQSLALWLNSDSQFSSIYIATATGAVVNILDPYGFGGTLAADTAGGIVATPSGVDSGLGINIGRSYAITYRDTSAGWESAPSSLSFSTGATGGATKIVISDLPVSADSRIDKIAVYATPDGGADGPLRLIALVNNAPTSGPFATVTDTITESALATRDPYGGEHQSAGSGPVTVTLRSDGAPLAVLVAGSGSARTNVIPGIVLGCVPQGAKLSVDFDNGTADTIDVRLILQSGQALTPVVQRTAVDGLANFSITGGSEL